MPQFKGATYFSMKGGLNTEASPLNIPVSDATDIKNIDINIDGSIQRRKAIDFVGLSSTNTLFETSDLASYRTISGSVLRAEVPTIAQFNPLDADGVPYKHVITHVGQTFSFYDYSSPELLREIDAPKQTIDRSSAPLKQCLYKTLLLANGNRAYVVNRKHPFGYIEYTASTDTFSFTEQAVQQRVNDPGDPDADPVVDPSSTIEDVGDSNNGWLTGCLSNSRVWVAGTEGYSNTVFFSQTIVNGDEYCKMYQEADPYDALDNQLVDTDGGSITLTGAEQILALAPLGSGVIVFANNGVWSIAGQDGFRATSYSINKISDAGIIGSQCWTSVEQQLIYFGEGNVYTILLGTSIDTPEVSPIGDKIVSFYNSIPIYNREAGKVVYNTGTKKLYYFCNFDSKDWITQYNPYKQMTLTRDVLVFDVRLAAWTTYQLTDDTDGDMLGISDAVILNGGMIQNVVVTDGGELVTDDGETITTQDPSATDSSLSLNFIFTKLSSITGATWKYAFGYLKPSGHVDFEASASDAESNTSSITLAHQLFQDVAHRKFAPYIIPLFQRIESGELDVDGEDITPGGCYYRVDWDWAITSNGPKFGTLRPAYFPYRFNLQRFGGGDSGIAIVSSKLKIRGSGEVFKLYFESDGDKDFKLYGWQLMVYAKARM